MWWVYTLIFFLILPAVKANVIFPALLVVYGYSGIVLLVPILLLETFVIIYLFRKYFGKSLKFWQCLAASVLVNFISAIIGIALSIGFDLMDITNYSQDPITYAGSFLFAFLLSAIIEFLILIPFFKKDYTNKIGLFKMSVIMNALSYSLVIIVLILLML